MEHTRRLGEERIPALLWRFSTPAIVGMMVNAMYNVIDRIFIGHALGSPGIAGVTIGFPIMIAIMACGMLVGIGANSLAAIRLGEHRRDEAELIMGNALILLLGVAAFVTAAGLVFIDPLLRLFGASRVVLPLARDYLRIILWGTACQTVGFGMNNFIRTEGNPAVAMYTMLIGALLNAALAPLFIFGFGWGIKGAALATVAAQTAAAAWVLWHFIGGRSALRIRWPNLRLRPAIVWSILAIGSAPFAMQLSAGFLNAIFNKSLAQYGGDIAISGMGVVMSLAMLFVLPVLGISQGAQPIIGYNYGARSFGRVKETLKLAALAATSVVTLGYIAIMIAPGALMGLFNRSDAALMAFGVHALRTFLIFLPIVGFQIVGANYFQAIGKPRQAMILSLSRQVLILIPALLILPRFLGLQGILIAGPLADLAASLLTGLWLWREVKRLNRGDEPGAQIGQILPGEAEA